MRNTIVMYVILCFISILGCSERITIVELESSGDFTYNEKKELKEYLNSIFIPVIMQTNLSKIKSMIPEWGFYSGGLVTLTGSDLEYFLKENTGIFYRYLYNNSSSEGMPPWLIKKLPFSTWLRNNFTKSVIHVRYSKSFYDKKMNMDLKNANIDFLDKTETGERYSFVLTYVEGRWFFSGVFQ